MILHTYQHDSVLRGSYEKKHFGLIWICIELVYSVLGFVSSSLVCRVLKFTSAYTAKTNWEPVYNPSSLFFHYSIFDLFKILGPFVLKFYFHFHKNVGKISSEARRRKDKKEIPWHLQHHCKQFAESRRHIFLISRLCFYFTEDIR